MTARHRIRSIGSLAALTAAGALLLSACSALPGAEREYPETPEDFATFEPVDFEGPEQPPYPPNRILDETEQAALQARTDDSRWQWQVAREFPEATRPAVALERYVEGEQIYQLLADCYEVSGVPFDLAAGGNGIATSELDEAQSIAAYVCQTRFQNEPWPGLTAEQMGWYYDYWVTSLIPCYAANGFDLTEESRPVPTREGYIAWRTSMQESLDGIGTVGEPWGPVFETWSLNEWDLRVLEDACVFDPLYVAPNDQG